MFQMRPQYPPHRPRPPHLYSLFTPQNHHQVQSKTTKDNLLAMFKTSEGNYDLEKIGETVQQITDIYQQISPMITKLRNK